MAKKKSQFKEVHIITITITCIQDDELGFENSIDEAVKKIKEGYTSGMDGNNDEDYSFTVTKEPFE